MFENYHCLLFQVTSQPVPSTRNVKVDEIKKQEAIKKKELGNKAYRKGQYDEALVLYNEAIELDPTQISFYNNKGGEHLRKIFVCSIRHVLMFLLSRNIGPNNRDTAPLGLDRLVE